MASCVPVIPFSYVFIDGECEASILAPVIGYSYAKNLFGPIGLGFSASIGMAYARLGEKITEEYQFDISGDGLRMQDEAYNAMKGIDKAYGCRANGNLSLTIKKDISIVSVRVGYTSYIFLKNFFNSYDVGLGYSVVF